MSISKQFLSDSLEEKIQNNKELETLQTLAKVYGLVSPECKLNDDSEMMLQELLNSIYEYKNAFRSEEETLKLMIKRLNRFELRSDELEVYYGVAQGKFINWEEFEGTTQKYIPIAQWLLTKLKNKKCKDYSTVVIESTSAIEYELLYKLFNHYILNLIDRKGKSLNKFLATDKSNIELIRINGPFARTIGKIANHKDFHMTLEEMLRIISHLENEDIVSNSPLLQDFKCYIRDDSNRKEIATVSCVSMLDSLIKEYRLPSTTPDDFSFDKAKECLAFVDDNLDSIVDCIK